MKYGQNLLWEDFLICQWMSIIKSSKMYNWNINNNYNYIIKTTLLCLKSGQTECYKNERPKVKQAIHNPPPKRGLLISLQKNSYLFLTTQDPDRMESLWEFKCLVQVSSGETTTVYSSLCEHRIGQICMATVILL